MSGKYTDTGETISSDEINNVVTPFVKDELIDLLYRQNSTGLITNLVIMISIYFYTEFMYGSPYSFAWLFVSACILLFRIGLHWVRGRTKEKLSSRSWLILFTIFSTLTGLSWGIATVLFFPLNHPVYQLFPIIVVAGLTAGAVPYLSSIPVVYHLYTMGTLFPFIIYSFYLGSSYPFLGMMGILYFFMNIASSFRISSVISRNLAMSRAEEILSSKLRNTISELANANRTKSMFVSSMSHELRTPLNAIIGYTQLLNIESQDYSKEAKLGIHEIQYAGQHLLDLVNDILDLSRIETRELTISLKPVKLDNLVSECVDLITPDAKKRNVVVTVTCTENRAVNADEKKLKQVLLNLLSNAVKYNLHGGFIDIAVHPVPNEPLDSITIKNSGKGISQDQLTSLFQPFNRLGAENSNIPGSGLGLYITKKLVELMDGSIAVTSDEKETSVVLTLPHIRSDVEIATRMKAQSPSIPSVITESTTPYTILYIEDTLSNITLLRTLMGRYRSHVRFEIAVNGSDGVEKAVELCPNVILTDIQLPDFDGYHVLKAIRANPELDSCAVIAISADARIEQMESAIAAGFDLYLTKPFKLDQLLNILDIAAFNRDALKQHLFIDHLS